MEERISQVLKNTEFFDFGTVIFASNHPDHVYLIEVENSDKEQFTVLYDKKHDYLNISKRIDIRNIDESGEMSHEDPNVELTAEQKQQIKQLLEASGNNVTE